MIQPTLINSVNAWERILEVKEEMQKAQRVAPYVNFLAAPQSCRKAQMSIFAQIFRPRQENRPSADIVQALSCPLCTE